MLNFVKIQCMQEKISGLTAGPTYPHPVRHSNFAIPLSELGKKVTTRPLRARGIAVSDALQRRMESLNQSIINKEDDSSIKSGDLGAILVRVGNLLCYAACEVMSF